MDEETAVSGWTPDGKVAGYRDPVTGNLDASSSLARPTVLLRQLLGLCIAAAAVATLYFGQDVLIPITLAFILSFVLSPIVKLLQRLRLWRVPAVLLTVGFALGLIGSLAMLIGTQTAALSENAPQYARAIEAKVQVAQGYALERMHTISKALSGKRKPARRGAATDSLLVTAPSATRPVLVEVAPPPTTPFSVASTILKPIVGPLETTFLVLVVAVFILVQKEDLRDRFIRVFGSGDLHRTTLALDDAGQRLSRYFLSQLVVNTGFALTIATGLWALGIPSPILWGVLAGLLRFVPYVGAVLAAAAPIALGAAIDPGWSTAIYIALYFFVVEATIGYVIEPLVYGHSTGLSPTSVVVSAIFWTWLWGPVGLVMSTPLTLCLVVLGRHVKALEFFDVLLGDRPALTPAERFYQRLLASNPDEALAQAEALYDECGLAVTYDRLVIPALRHAADDHRKSLLDAARVAAVKQTLADVIDDLGTIARSGAADAPVSAGARTVICIAGPGRFDDLLTEIARQISQAAGVPSRSLSHEASARHAIDRLDVQENATLVLCYIEPGDALAHLRFLIRRLRQRVPDARITTGFWSPGGNDLTDDLKNNLGADAYVEGVQDLESATALLNGPAAAAPPSHDARVRSTG